MNTIDINDKLTSSFNQAEKNVKSDRTIADILQEKEEIINNLSGQITKYKCEQLKNIKIIKGLQQKIAQIAPSSSDTGSNFMMASEFRVVFEDFMSNTVCSTFGNLLEKPKLYKKIVADSFMYIFNGIQLKLNRYLYDISLILKIQSVNSLPQKICQIKNSLLKFIQENWEVLFPHDKNRLQYSCQNREIFQTDLQLINDILDSNDYKQFQLILHKICIYMILQQKKWQFVFPQENKLLSYSKKQSFCLDGWLKEGQAGFVVLEGIKKENHLHPNLKNYLVPPAQDDPSDYEGQFVLLINTEQNLAKIIKQNPKIHIHKSLNLQDNLIKDITDDLILPQSCIFVKKENQAISNKQNLPHSHNKKPKRKEKQESLSQQQKSPHYKYKKQKCQENMTKKKKSQNELLIMKQFDEKIIGIKEEINNKKKSLNLTKNVQSINNYDHFDEAIMLPLKQRKPLQEFPMSRELIIRKKSKANTSRKNSVGKIVNQQHIITNQQSKQNQNGTHNKIFKQKQKNYKDIIKEKMMDQKLFIDRSAQLLTNQPKLKSQRQKRKQQNRPLKLNNNINKLREKYITDK